LVTLTLAGRYGDDMTLRRVAEELTQRLASVKNVSRAYVVGGRPRVVQVLLDPDRMAAHHVSRWNCSAPSKRPTSGRRPAISAAGTR
jgi:multidrug efflux pump subunit AcrB